MEEQKFNERACARNDAVNAGGGSALKTRGRDAATRHPTLIHPVIIFLAELAQLVAASPRRGEGRRFNSDTRHNIPLWCNWLHT